jgi:hypothetical protein
MEDGNYRLPRQILYIYKVASLPLEVTLRHWSAGYYYLMFMFLDHLCAYLTYSWLAHGVRPFFGSRQSCSYSRTFQHFMKAENSSQEPSTLSWARSIQSIPLHYTSLRFVLILFNHLHTHLPIVLFSSVLCHEYPICIHLLFLRATCPAHFIFLIIHNEEYVL